MKHILDFRTFVGETAYPMPKLADTVLPDSEYPKFREWALVILPQMLAKLDGAVGMSPEEMANEIMIGWDDAKNMDELQRRIYAYMVKRDSMESDEWEEKWEWVLDQYETYKANPAEYVRRHHVNPNFKYDPNPDYGD
jgi:hypothetical protein